MTRKATDNLKTIGLDISKNSFHLIGLDGCFGSKADIQHLAQLRPLLGVKRT